MCSVPWHDITPPITANHRHVNFKTVGCQESFDESVPRPKALVWNPPMHVIGVMTRQTNLLKNAVREIPGNDFYPC